MATATLAQPALYLDTTPSASQAADLFTVEFPGVTLKLTPYAMMGLLLKSRRIFEDWNAVNNAKARGVIVEETAELIAFPKACPLVRCVGEAC